MQIYSNEVILKKNMNKKAISFQDLIQKNAKKTPEKQGQNTKKM